MKEKSEYVLNLEKEKQLNNKAQAEIEGLQKELADI